VPHDSTLETEGPLSNRFLSRLAQASPDGAPLHYLRAILVDATKQLFSSVSLSIKLDDAPPAEGFIDEGDVLLAFLGFTGDDLQGTLLLSIDHSLAASLADQLFGLPGTTASMRRDCVAELSNQLIGRIKNRLLRYSIEIFLSTPKALTCAHFGLATTPGDGKFKLVFQCEAGRLVVWFDAESVGERGHGHGQTTIVLENIGKEGELTLF